MAVYMTNDVKLCIEMQQDKALFIAYLVSQLQNRIFILLSSKIKIHTHNPFHLNASL